MYANPVYQHSSYHSECNLIGKSTARTICTRRTLLVCATASPGDLQQQQLKIKQQQKKQTANCAFGTSAMQAASWPVHATFGEVAKQQCCIIYTTTNERAFYYIHTTPELNIHASVTTSSLTFPLSIASYVATLRLLNTPKTEWTVELNIIVYRSLLAKLLAKTCKFRL